MMKNKRFSIIGAILLLIMFCVVSSSEAGQKVYYGTKKPKKSEPPPTTGQPANPPWTEAGPNGEVPAPGQPDLELPRWGTFYLGIGNIHMSNYRKTLTITITGPGAHKIVVRGSGGVYTPDGSSYPRTTYGTTRRKKKGPPESVVITIKYNPQPDWEWIRLRNSGSKQKFNITVEADSECEQMGQVGMHMDMEGMFGAQDYQTGSMLINEVSIFPENEMVDTLIPPNFMGPPGSGNWTPQWVYADPDGNPRPQGGVRWFSDGLGMAAEEIYWMDFAMIPQADDEYSLFAFDTDSYQYQSYLLEVWPLSPWPVTRHDIATTGKGIATNGAGPVPDWVALIPGGGVTHGGISILPDGDLVWKSYGPSDGINDGRVYRFNPATQTIVWDSIATAGIGTGQWAHGGVAVGKDGLYFGSRDGTYSVGKLDYNGNFLWAMAFSGPDIDVRGTPVLNPSEDRLYVRDAGSIGYIYCVDTNTGGVIWTYNLDAAMHGDGAYSSFGMLTGWGSGGEGDMELYHTTSDADEDICLVDNGASAAVLWSNAEMNFSWHGSQAYWDSYLYCSTFADGNRPSIYKVDADTGDIIWSLSAIDGAANHFCRPAIGPDGTIYVGGHTGKLTAYSDDGLTGSLRWSYTSFGEFNNYVTVAGTEGDTWIYAIRNDNIMYAFRDDGMQTMPNIMWTYQIGPTHYFGSYQATVDSDGGLYVAGGYGNDDTLFGTFELYHFPPFLPVDPPVITDVERGSMKVTFTGGGQTYKVQSSISGYDYDESLMTWIDEATGLAPGTWEDTAPPTGSGAKKFYRVVGETDGSESDTVGMMVIDVFNGRNLVSTPFEPYPEGGGTPGVSTLDKIIGDQLSGHPAVKTLSDNIEIWDSTAQDWGRAWYRLGTGWEDWYVAFGAPFAFEADTGYWINRTLSHPDTTVTLFGKVSTAARTIAINPKRNLVGSCYPVSVALDDSGLVASGFIGHPAVKTLSDNVEFWSNSALDWQRFWYRLPTGFEGWNIGQPMKDIEPGDAFYVNLPIRTVGFTWTYPVP